MNIHNPVMDIHIFIMGMHNVTKGKYGWRYGFDMLSWVNVMQLQICITELWIP